MKKYMYSFCGLFVISCGIFINNNYYYVSRQTMAKCVDTLEDAVHKHRSSQSFARFYAYSYGREKLSIPDVSVIERAGYKTAYYYGKKSAANVAIEHVRDKLHFKLLPLKLAELFYEETKSALNKVQQYSREIDRLENMANSGERHLIEDQIIHAKTMKSYWLGISDGYQIYLKIIFCRLNTPKAIGGV